MSDVIQSFYFYLGQFPHVALKLGLFALCWNANSYSWEPGVCFGVLCLFIDFSYLKLVNCILSKSSEFLWSNVHSQLGGLTKFFCTEHDLPVCLREALKALKHFNQVTGNEHRILVFIWCLLLSNMTCQVMSHPSIQLISWRSVALGHSTENGG